MNILISGGCKNGKTGFAQELARRLSGDGLRYYVATMIPCDEEDRVRITRHILDRSGMGFITLEAGTGIASCLEQADTEGTFLVDSLTALLANEMFPAGEGRMDLQAASRCLAGVRELMSRVRHTVLIADYIFSDAVHFDAATENYRAGLAFLCRSLARECDTVMELCAGQILYHKGGPPV